jgi:hypothetical protein
VGPCVNGGEVLGWRWARLTAELARQWAGLADRQDQKKRIKSPISLSISQNLEIVSRPRKIARYLEKWKKFSGGKLEYLEQLSLLTLCPNLNRIWIKIQIHPKLEFEWIEMESHKHWFKHEISLILNAQNTLLETCGVTVSLYK